MQESSSINTSNEKYKVFPFTPASIKSEVNNENNSQNHERENEYVYNYSANERSPVSVIPSKQYQESANRSSSHSHK